MILQLVGVLVGAVGDDLFGRDYVQAFKRSGVLTDLVAVLAGQSTGVAPILMGLAASRSRGSKRRVS